MKILLIVYDNDSYTNFFPLGISYIASLLQKDNHEVEIYEQNVHHYSDEHLTNYLDNSIFDVVGMGIVAGYYQWKKLLNISKAVNNSKNRKKFKYILGGHGVSVETEYIQKITNADKIFVGEVGLNLLQWINSNCKLLKNDVDNILPSWDLFTMEHYVLYRFPGLNRSDKVMSIISGKGCPYKCNFCFRMIKGFYPRKTEDIINELKILKNKYNITAVEFCDELLMSSEKRTIEISESLEPLNIKWWCNGRLNIVNKKILTSMKKAGCIFVNYGIESLDDNMLKIMNKKLTVEQIIRGVEDTIEIGIIPGLNIIFGNIGETIDILWKGVEFIKKYNQGDQLRTIRFVTMYPGTPLYYYCIEKGYLTGIEDFYNKHTNSDLLTVNLTPHTDEECYEALKLANIELINNYYSKNKNIIINQCKDLYEHKNKNFRGFRSV